jgi:hypothetical protein
MEDLKVVWYKLLIIYLRFLVGTITVFFAGSTLLLWSRGEEFTHAVNVSRTVLLDSVDMIGILVFSIPYLSYHALIYFRRVWLQQGRGLFFKRLGFFTVAPIVLIFTISKINKETTPSEKSLFNWEESIFSGSNSGTTKIERGGKIRGVHYFSRFRDGEIDFGRLVENNIEYLVLVPYAYQERYDDPNLQFNRQGRRGGSFNRDSLYLEIANHATACGMKVLIKPHIWMRTDLNKWRSDIDFSEPSAFQEWSDNYTAFIMHYAILSAQMQASHFCIGTELAGVTKNHPEYWRTLIKQVREVYEGKVFYAANWYQEYEQISFWDELDYVGIQAYFPLCNKANPSIEELMAGWKPIVNKLKKFSRNVSKPILFSELGYKSTHDAAIDPWEWVDSSNKMTKTLSAKTQAHCYEACFRSLWDQPWFAGTLIWQWNAHYDQDSTSTSDNIDFTPQHKPAQDIMAKWFGK